MLLLSFYFFLGRLDIECMGENTNHASSLVIFVFSIKKTTVVNGDVSLISFEIFIFGESCTFSLY